MKDSIQLLKICFDFLSSLSEEQLQSLLEKKAKLKFDNGQNGDNAKKPTTDITQICEFLDNANTREVAREYLEKLDLGKTALKELAKHYDIPVLSRDKSIQLLEKIIENAVGAKLKFDTLLNSKIT